MDVRCERCKTQYELDDSRISETGVTVQCTTCHHVFVVKKKALVVTVPVRPDQVPPGPSAPQGDTPAVPLSSPPPALRPLSPPTDASAPGATAESPAPSLPPAAAAPGAREWRVRQSTGNTFTFKDLTTLQKWIVERKVSRDDEISLTGETWKRLGDIAELATFFQVVDEAQKAVVLQAQVNMAQGAAPPGAPQSPASPAGPPQQPPPQPQKSRLPTILILLGVLLGLGAAGYYFLMVMPRPEDVAQREANARLEEERRQKEQQERERQAQALAAQAATGAQLRADAGGTTGFSEDGGALAATGTPDAGDGGALGDAGTTSDAGTGADAGAAPDAGTGADAGLTSDAGMVLDAGSSADAGPASDAGTPGVKKPAPVRDFDYYLSQGDRLRERDHAESALDAYAQAAELDPDRVEPYVGRGLALLDMDDPRQAEAEFKQALKIDPKYPEAIMGLAETYRSQGKNAQAIRYYERYLEILPNGPDASVARSAIERLKE